MMSNSVESRPYKVWSADQRVKKGVVAASLAELINKGKAKLDYEEVDCLKLVLEEDGTEVEDEDYFACLEQNTIFILLRQHEQWWPLAASSGNRDETDNMEVGDRPSSLDNVTAAHRVRSLADIVRSISHKMAQIVALSITEMEMVVEAEATELARLMRSSVEDARHMQLTTQRYLDDRQKAVDAIELLNLYSTSQPGSKRQRQQ